MYIRFKFDMCIYMNNSLYLDIDISVYISFKFDMYAFI